MGALFGFDLLFERSALRFALETLVTIADAEGTRGCRVYLPGEPPLDVPFEVGGEDGEDGERTVYRAGRLDEWLTGSLRLPVDERGRALLGDAPPAGADGRASIGAVSIGVFPGSRSGLIAVGATTSRMSHFFAGSPAVRGAFREVLRSARGLLGLINFEPGDADELLDRPGVLVDLCAQRSNVYAGDARAAPEAVDAFTAAAVRAAGSV